MPLCWRQHSGWALRHFSACFQQSVDFNRMQRLIFGEMNSFCRNIHSMRIPSKSILVAALLSCSCISIHAQNNNRESITLGFGYSKSGSGDLPGVMLTTEYRKYVKQRVFLTTGLGANMHYGDMPIFYTTPTGNDRDGSIREVTAGFQLHGLAGWDFVQAKRHSVGIAAGPMLRYQATTSPDMVSIYYPAATGMPFPLVLFDHREDQRIFSVGGMAQLSYRYQAGRRFILGALGSFQTDTNSDVIFQAGASIGVKL